MKLLKTTNIWRSVFALAIMLCTSMSYSQDLAQAKALCGNVTAANKAMAKQAGYDLDALCSEVATGCWNAAKALCLNSQNCSKTACHRSVFGRHPRKHICRRGCARCRLWVLAGTQRRYASLKPFGYDLICKCSHNLCPGRKYPCVCGLSCWGLAIRWIFFFTVRQIIRSRSRSIERVLLIFLSWAPSVWRD